MSIEDMSKHTPIVPPGTPAIQIPKGPRMVTQIIAVRQANAAQLTQDLLPLLPDNSIMTANSAGNALMITATEADVKRMAEIVEAIDGSISNNTQLKVFPLRNADAKELATIVSQLFDTSSGRGGGRGNIQFNLGGGRGGGGF
jgi:type II secretory pathway component GspD/PulD (secretin)